jgi:hypothetical protein
MLSELAEQAQPKFTDFLNRLDAALGENRYIVFEGRRTVAVQQAYYAQGRELLEDVNRLRQQAGLRPIFENENRKAITWTLKSKHIEGLAMDVLPVDGRGNPTWDLPNYRIEFETIRECGKQAGLICGADWRPNTDWPHYEI